MILKIYYMIIPRRVLEFSVDDFVGLNNNDEGHNYIRRRDWYIGQ